MYRQTVHLLCPLHVQEADNASDPWDRSSLAHSAFFCPGCGQVHCVRRCPCGCLSIFCKGSTAFTGLLHPTSTIPYCPGQPEWAINQRLALIAFARMLLEGRMLIDRMGACTLNSVPLGTGWERKRKRRNLVKFYSLSPKGIWGSFVLTVQKLFTALGFPRKSAVQASLKSSQKSKRVRSICVFVLWFKQG